MSLNGALTSGNTPGAVTLPIAWISALGLNVNWIRLHDNVVFNQGGRRFYNLQREVAGSGLSRTWAVEPGTSWWGFEVNCANVSWSSYKGVKSPFIIALPSNHKKHVYNVGDTQMNITQVPGKKWSFYLPDPSMNSKWDGQINAKGKPDQSINFDRRDPLFNPGGVFSQSKYDLQTSLHERLLSEAEMFLHAPYGWGGQTFGGKQSVKPNLYTDSNSPSSNNEHGEVKILGSSFTERKGFGIDCSGFITEPARRIGIAQPSEPTGMGTGALKAGVVSGTTYSTPVDPRYLSPGDYIVWRIGDGGHVVYVKEVYPTFLPNNTWRVDQITSLEAYPDSKGIQGRVKIQTRQRGSWEDASGGYSFRRWKSP